MRAAAIEDQDGIEVVDEIQQLTPDPAVGAVPAAAKESPEAIALKAANRELKSTRARLKESDTTAQFWMEQGRRQPAVVAAVPQVDPDADLDEVDIVTELTEHGFKGLVSRLDKRYAKPQDVKAEIGSTRLQITQDAKLLRDYPGLDDAESDFFKATAKIYNSLIADDPYMKQSPKTVATAARLAKAEMGTIPIDRGGRRRVATPDLDDDEDLDDLDEAETREERVGRQSGDRGRGKGRTAEVEELSPLQKSIVRKFRAAGADSLTEETYMKRATIGVRLGGRAPQAARTRAA